MGVNVIAGKERIGLPILAYPVLLIAAVGIVGIILDDLRMMYIVFMFYVVAIIAFMLWIVIGAKIKRNGKITRQFEEGNIAVTVHCTKYMLGGRPIVVENNGSILAKLWQGNTLSLPLNLGPIELFVYRNKHNKTKACVNVENESEIFLWFDHGEIDPTRIVVIKKGDPLPETRLQESYIKMKKTVVALTILTLVGGGAFMIFSLHELGLI
jgi:sulfur carrier protein ThiS